MFGIKELISANADIYCNHSMTGKDFVGVNLAFDFSSTNEVVKNIIPAGHVSYYYEGGDAETSELNLQLCYDVRQKVASFVKIELENEVAICFTVLISISNNVKITKFEIVKE